MSDNLSAIQNNLALVFALEEAKIAVMRKLSEQFEQLKTLDTTFGETAVVFQETADSLEGIHQQSRAAMGAFDLDGKVAVFLEKHVLSPIWMERLNK